MSSCSTTGTRGDKKPNFMKCKACKVAIGINFQLVKIAENGKHHFGPHFTSQEFIAGWAIKGKVGSH